MFQNLIERLSKNQTTRHISMIRFIESNEMKVEVFKSQENQISTKEKIKQNTQRHDTIAFDIYKNQELIGFVMLREFEEGKFFLWNFAIDKKHQNKGLGTLVLKALIEFLKANYTLNALTTTYKNGNSHARHLYEKIGFCETEHIVDGEINEVNMELEI